MSWANVLHFYQPYGQKRQIIDAIVAQCYRPVGEALLKYDDARLTINFTGVLLDQLAEYGHQDVIELYAEAVRRGRVELVGSAKFHAILPLLPPDEARRQIEINDEANRRHFGDLYQRRGIFLPEMGWHPDLAPLLEKLGFDWVLLDELAYNGRVGQVDYMKLYEIEGTRLKAFFREHRLSATIMSAAPRDVQSLKDAARDELGQKRYIVTAMDGETFGHHRIGHEQLLFGMFRDPDIGLVRLSDILSEFSEVETVKTVACTWASSEDDLAKGISYISWLDPENEIHKLQLELQNLVTEQMAKAPKEHPDYAGLRERLDPALASDQFFWAAARPWWMIEHIEGGAYALLDIMQYLPNVDPRLVERSLSLYHEIVGLAYHWQRSGKIEALYKAREELVRIPFKDHTLGKGDKGSWEAFLHLLQREEERAVQRGDYEAAILWRDGRYKLDHRLDIYDVHYILDLLNRRLPKGDIEETVARYKAKFDHIRGGQVEQRSN